MQGKAVYKRPKWSDPSPDPAQAAATCSGAALYTKISYLLHLLTYTSKAIS